MQKDWLKDQMNRWLKGELKDWLKGWMKGWLKDWLEDWLKDWLKDCRVEGRLPVCLLANLPGAHTPPPPCDPTVGREGAWERERERERERES